VIAFVALIAVTKTKAQPECDEGRQNDRGICVSKLKSI